MFGRNSSGHPAGEPEPSGSERHHVDAVRFSPPEGVSAAEAAVLLDGRTGPRAVATMLVDLRAQGWYDMECEDGRWAFVTRRHLPPPGARPLLDAERLLLSAVFRPSPADETGDDVPVQYVSMASLAHRLQGHVEAIGTALGEHLVARGLVSRNPARRGLTRRGSLLTPAGESVRDECAGYRLYLSRAETGALLNDDAEGFVGASLPYAVAFDIVPRWAQAIGASSVAGTGVGASLLRDLQRNPLLVAVASGASSGFDFADLTTLAVARHYGARFPGDGSARR